MIAKKKRENLKLTNGPGVKALMTHPEWYSFSGGDLEDPVERDAKADEALREICEWIIRGDNPIVSHLLGFCRYKGFTNYQVVHNWSNNKDYPHRKIDIENARKISADRIISMSYNRIMDTGNDAEASEVALRKLDFEASRYLAGHIYQAGYGDKKVLEHASSTENPLKLMIELVQGSGSRPRVIEHDPDEGDDDE